jgi:transposase
MLLEGCMQVIYQRCCGLDIHKKLIVACLLIMSSQGVQKEIRTFRTTLPDLYRLRDWLVANECQMVAMESTGVYWRPIWNVLEEELALMLVNAQHMKAVPGRKTDMKDAEWIAELLQHGLLRASFVPPRPQRELREVTRYRSKLVEERARLVNRIQKVLEDSNVKLASVATDITGVSGRAILRALLDGEDDPEVLAELARGRMRSKREELTQAVQGTLREHHRFLLKSQLRQLDFYDTQISELDQEIARRLGMPTCPDDPKPLGSGPLNGNRASSADQVPDCATDSASHSPEPSSDTARSQAEVMRILDEVTGINQRIAQIVVAELGVRLDQFQSSGHLVSWAGLCPAAKISAGKRLSTKTGKGNRWLKQALIEAAHGAARSKNTYLGPPTNDSRNGWAARKPSWPWPTASWSSSITCLRKSNLIVNSVQAMPTNKLLSRPSAGQSAAWSNSALRSRSLPTRRRSPDASLMSSLAIIRRR